MNNLTRRIKYRLGCYRKRGSGGYVAKGVLIMVILVVIMFAAEQRIGSLALRLGEVQLENEIVNECNKIAAKLLDEYDEYAVSVTESGSEERYDAVSVSFTELNKLKCDLTDELTEYLKSYDEIVCYVPMGALLSNDIFAARGIRFPIKITATGTARVDFLDDFDTGGINQTRHRLMLRAVVRVQLHTVSEKSEKIIQTDIPVSERLIVGDVPSWVTGVN